MENFPKPNIKQEVQKNINPEIKEYRDELAEELSDVRNVSSKDAQELLSEKQEDKKYLKSKNNLIEERNYQLEQRDKIELFSTKLQEKYGLSLNDIEERVENSIDYEELLSNKDSSFFISDDYETTGIFGLPALILSKTKFNRLPFRGDILSTEKENYLSGYGSRELNLEQNIEKNSEYILDLIKRTENITIEKKSNFKGISGNAKTYASLQKAVLENNEYYSVEHQNMRYKVDTEGSVLSYHNGNFNLVNGASIPGRFGFNENIDNYGKYVGITPDSVYIQLTSEKDYVKTDRMPEEIKRISSEISKLVDEDGLKFSETEMVEKINIIAMNNSVGIKIKLNSLIENFNEKTNDEILKEVKNIISSEKLPFNENYFDLTLKSKADKNNK